MIKTTFWFILFNFLIMEYSYSNLNNSYYENKALKIINKYSIFNSNNNKKNLIENFDPYLEYLSEEDLIALNEARKIRMSGIGVEIIKNNNNEIKINNILPESPAEYYKLKKGDQIIKINNQNINFLSLKEIINKIRGPSNSNVKLTILRYNIRHPIEFNIIRKSFITNPISLEIKNNIAYIKIKSFNTGTYNEFLKKINQINKNNIQHIKIDLRDNKGGLLIEAVKICSYFLKKGIVTYTKGKHKNSNKTYKVITTKQKDYTIPLTIIINKESASASELVASCLQDYRRAKIEGERSAGKGSVQLFRTIDKKTAIKLTEAEFYRPNGKKIQNIGVSPDK